MKQIGEKKKMFRSSIIWTEWLENKKQNALSSEQIRILWKKGNSAASGDGPFSLYEKNFIAKQSVLVYRPILYRSAANHSKNLNLHSNYIKSIFIASLKCGIIIIKMRHSTSWLLEQADIIDDHGEHNFFNFCHLEFTMIILKFCF
jgi:hypothetical protein